MRLIKYTIFVSLIFAFFSCDTENDVKDEPELNEKVKMIQERIDSYAPTKISADLSNLTDNQRKVIDLLVEAGEVADEIFWIQNTPDGKSLRDSLSKIDNDEAEILLEYLNINYGPYDEIHNLERFVGEGPSLRPQGGNFYPLDLTKEEFEKYIEENPEQKEALTSLYTIVRRDGDSLKAIPYNEAYSDLVSKLANLLEEAAEYADNKSLKNYLTLRAEAIRTDEYLESDLAWMDLKDNDIDVVIGPIENYSDKLFGYKTAYESIVMVKDREASKELDMFQENINNFEQRLPYDEKYIRKSISKGNILQVVNIAYFGGSGQQGSKTIAASLPNDPRVHERKGSKKSMFKNMMEAKFDQIVIPIAEKILAPELRDNVDKAAFTSFVTLHEVSHTLGRSYVYGEDNVKVSSVIKDRYAALEECKADIVGLWNIKIMRDLGLIDDEYVEKTKATYTAGLYRSIRFGADKAHGKGNLIQLNYLMDKGAIVEQEDGTLNINDDIFFDIVGELAGKVLTIQAEGNYEEAGNLFKDYGNLTDKIKANIEKLKDIPRDLNTTYEF